MDSTQYLINNISTEKYVFNAKIEDCFWGVQRTGRSCSYQRGTIFQFVVRISDTLYELYRVCFNEAEYVTYWARNKVYTKDTRDIRLDTDFDNSYFAVNRINLQHLKQAYTLNGYQRGHLAPNADFPIQYGHLTYYYINTAPQIAYFNNIWGQLERVVRTRFYSAVAYTGTLTGGTNFYIYPGNTCPSERINIPVPLYFWKAVIIDDKTGIAFIGRNQDQNSSDMINWCKSTNEQFNWILGEATKEFVVVCSPQELSQVLFAEGITFDYPNFEQLQLAIIPKLEN